MHILLGFLGMVASIAMIKYRAQLGDMMGDPDWMKYVGGVYNFVIILAIVFFFWSIAYMTNTTDVLFRPLLLLFPNPNPQTVPGVVQ
ncbi:MAG TPA: hypothetical protein VHA78_04295 [Candidatus Peribacteraceae bacterium]|nr:hypothetical protein [Candidatus Peribacteraceae bacterium]